MTSSQPNYLPKAYLCMPSCGSGGTSFSPQHHARPSAVCHPPPPPPLPSNPSQKAVCHFPLWKAGHCQLSPSSFILPICAATAPRSDTSTLPTRPVQQPPHLQACPSKLSVTTKTHTQGNTCPSPNLCGPSSQHPLLAPLTYLGYPARAMSSHSSVFPLPGVLLLISQDPPHWVILGSLPPSATAWLTLLYTLYTPCSSCVIVNRAPASLNDWELFIHFSETQCLA